MGTLHYRSNNSGGSWWLKDADWHALEAAGWTVDWAANEQSPILKSAYKNGRYMGALAVSAHKDFETAEAGVEEWEQATGQIASEEGCNCCGQPHGFEFTDDSGESHYMSLVSRGNDMSWS